jgi:hypothetical protein
MCLNNNVAIMCINNNNGWQILCVYYYWGGVGLAQGVCVGGVGWDGGW